MGRRKITVWERLYIDDNGARVYEHNHIDDGHIAGDAPVPLFESQKSWAGADGWRKTYAHLDENNVVVYNE